MKFDLSSIEFSKNDHRTGVELPKILTVDLAEFIGIIVGDGHLGFYQGKEKNGRDYVEYQIRIAGNKKEQDYLEYVRRLFYSLFHINLYYTNDRRSNTVILRKNSKGILQFLNKICEIPVNAKTHIVCIPKIVKSANKKIKQAFLRGLADTDFSVVFVNKNNKGHNYPVIKGSFASRRLVEDLEILYRELGFSFCTVYNEKGYDKRRDKYTFRNSIYLNGRKNFANWTENISFCNLKFAMKVKKWQADGICPPGYW